MLSFFVFAALKNGALKDGKTSYQKEVYSYTAFYRLFAGYHFDLRFDGLLSSGPFYGLSVLLDRILYFRFHLQKLVILFDRKIDDASIAERNRQPVTCDACDDAGGTGGAAADKLADWAHSSSLSLELN